MTVELKIYILNYCRNWMTPTEIKALRQLSIHKDALDRSRKLASKNPKFEALYGFGDAETSRLVNLGQETCEMAIAKRVLHDHEVEVMNYCSKCGKLARTPKAKQCRFCAYDWH